MKILFASTAEAPQAWLPQLAQALPEDSFTTTPAQDVDIALVAMPPAGTFARLGRLKLVQSLWMGVEKLLAEPALPRGVPIARLVDPGMVAAMSETVLVHVLDWHRHLYAYREQQHQRVWREIGQRLAADRTVGLLGLGELGSDAARKLAALGFRVAGWSRRPKALAGVETFTELEPLLRAADALVCLLPLTAQTRGILNAKAFSLMKRGGCLVNVGRGGHLVVADLLAALDSGRLAHAYLDVFDEEPLPPGDPLWRHPRVSVTPHVAALSDPRTALPQIVENVERARRGEPPLHPVDPAQGY